MPTVEELQKPTLASAFRPVSFVFTASSVVFLIVLQFETSPLYLNSNVLRSYQLEGLNWLAFNFQQRRSVLLADEMGLV